MTLDLTQIEAQLQSAPEEAIRRWEKEYFDRLNAVADRILSEKESSPIVLLAGPSGSAKTTTGIRLKERLEALGNPAHVISMDNYFLSLNEDYPRTPEGKKDFESPLCLDMDLLNSHFATLEAGEDVYVPYFDFLSGMRDPDRQTLLDASSGDIFIFEGIHALNPAFTGAHPNAFRLYVAPDKYYTRNGKTLLDPILLRLMRRSVRDAASRGADMAYTLELWPNVLDGEKKYILPYRDSADEQIDSALSYEPQALCSALLPVLLALPREVCCRDSVDRLISALRETVPLTAPIPGTSILHEFLG